MPFIAFDREAPTRKALDRLFREKGLELNPAMEMDNVETIKRAVEMGLGVAVLPAATVQHEVAQGSLVAKPFAEGTYTRPIGLLVRKGKYLDRASRRCSTPSSSPRSPPRSRNGPSPSSGPASLPGPVPPLPGGPGPLLPQAAVPVSFSSARPGANAANQGVSRRAHSSGWVK